jgi:hypothetical protein
MTVNKAWKISWFFTFLWCVFEFYPVSEAALDRWRMTQSIPNLANFESETELLRWNDGVYERYPSEALGFSKKTAPNKAQSKNHVLKVTLNTHRYTGIVGAGLFRDWSGYDALQFDVYNPNDYDLNLNIKVEDESAMGGAMGYHNRYNGKYKLRSGSNRIRVTLEEIANGPRGREMDLSKIHRLSFFFSRLPEPSFIYLDNVTLLK